jgi:hypothetical protein
VRNLDWRLSILELEKKKDFVEMFAAMIICMRGDTNEAFAFLQ